MLKKLIVVAIVANFLFILGSVITSVADNTANYNIGASVPEFLEINSILMPLIETQNGFEPDWNNTVSSLDFGELEPVYVNGSLSHLQGATGYAAVMFPVTSGRRYQLVESAGPLEGGDSGNATIPDGAFVIIPDYVAEDQIGGVAQGSFPVGQATLHPPVSAVGINRPIYTSLNGETRAIRAYLAIPSPNEVTGDIRNYSRGSQGGSNQGSAQIYGGWEPVTTNQESGSYSGSVTFTLNLI